jgi:hypothetical protein
MVAAQRSGTDDAQDQISVARHRSPVRRGFFLFEDPKGIGTQSCVLTTSLHHGHGDRNQEIKLREKLEEDEFTVIEGVSAPPLCCSLA